MVSADAVAFLRDWHFAGEVDGYPEGEVFFAHSPILTVHADFASAVVLETLVLSILNHDSAIASAAARFRLAAGGKRLLEGGSRRTDDHAAVAAARVAYVAGFDVTSNLEAGFGYGVPTGGTAAHAFTLAHDDELAAFRAQAARLGPGTTFLVDTFDVAQGTRNAVAATDGRLGGVRIDSGDLAAGARTARAILDAAGCPHATITVSGDLDEHGIAAIEASGAPVDAYLAGTKLVTGSGEPTAHLVYKLVAVADRAGPGAHCRPVAKRSTGKADPGGRKTAWRLLDGTGTATGEVALVDAAGPPCAGARPLQVPLVRGGARVDDGGVREARARCGASLAELPAAALGRHATPPFAVATRA